MIQAAILALCQKYEGEINQLITRDEMFRFAGIVHELTAAITCGDTKVGEARIKQRIAKQINCDVTRGLMIAKGLAKEIVKIQNELANISENEIEYIAFWSSAENDLIGLICSYLMIEYNKRHIAAKEKREQISKEIIKFISRNNAIGMFALFFCVCFCLVRDRMSLYGSVILSITVSLIGAYVQYSEFIKEQSEKTLTNRVRYNWDGIKCMSLVLVIATILSEVFR